MRPRWPAAASRWVLAAVVVGFALRAVFVVAFPEYVTGDSIWYRDTAQVYAREGLFGADLAKFDRPPLYPWFLSWFAHVWGADLLVPAGLAQCVLAAGGVWCLADLVRSLFPERTWFAVAAAWLAALDPTAVELTKHLGTEGLATPLLLAFLASAARCLPAPTFKGLARTAVVGSLIVLTRVDLAATILPALLVFAWIARKRHGVPSTTWLRWAACGAAILLLCVPWSLHASARRGQRMFVSSPTVTPVVLQNHGWARFCGSVLLPRHVWNGLWWMRSEGAEPAWLPESAFDSPEERTEVLALMSAARAAGHPLPEAEDAFARIARERAARHPVRHYLLYPLARSAYVWLDPFDDDRPDVIAHTRRSLVHRAFDGWSFVWVVIGGVGFLAAWGALLRPTAAPFVLGALVLGRTYSLLLLGPAVFGGNAFVERRYVTCVEPLAEALAVSAVVAIAARSRTRRAPSESGPAQLPPIS